MRLRDLAATLQCLRVTCEEMLSERLNFFGAFRKDLVLNDLRNLCYRVVFLLGELEPNRDEREGDKNAYDMADADDSDSLHPLISHVPAKLFWLKHFKRHAVEVRWDVFAAAFEAEFGADLERRVGTPFDYGTKAIGGGAPASSSSSSLSGGGGGGGGGSSRRGDMVFGGAAGGAAAASDVASNNHHSGSTGSTVGGSGGGGMLYSALSPSSTAPGQAFSPWQMEVLHAAFVKGVVRGEPLHASSSSFRLLLFPLVVVVVVVVDDDLRLVVVLDLVVHQRGDHVRVVHAAAAAAGWARATSSSTSSSGGSSSSSSTGDVFGASSTRGHKLAGTVSIHDYDAVTAKVGRGGNLYATFMALCDPVTVVYEMGTVEDKDSGVVDRPQLVWGLLGLPVKQICCGGQHAAVLTAFGTVLTWGRGGFGRLGHGKTDTLEAPRFVETLLGKTCCQVACGFAYTAAVTSEGQLYTWGAGENGRLGLGDVEDRHSPSFVEELAHTPVQMGLAGSVHTCVLTRTGSVYSFGKHEYTGHGDETGDVLPRLLEDCFEGKVIRQISVGPGGYHTIALTTSGVSGIYTRFFIF